MPPKLPRISGEQAVRALQRLNFVVVRQRGSHVILKKQVSGEVIGWIVALHHELAVGTLRSILRQARVTPEEFLENI
jgi:predicted RNA binding protein YcfA (HicA-like mRNA interferase family)